MDKFLHSQSTSTQQHCNVVTNTSRRSSFLMRLQLHRSVNFHGSGVIGKSRCGLREVAVAVSSPTNKLRPTDDERWRWFVGIKGRRKSFVVTVADKPRLRGSCGYRNTAALQTVTSLCSATYISWQSDTARICFWAQVVQQSIDIDTV